MRLVLLPAMPSDSNGYGIAVKDDISRLALSDNDIVVYYTNDSLKDDEPSKVINRFPRLSWRRVSNLLFFKTSTEISTKDLKKLHIDLDSVNEIFCGEVVFYRALRSLFPSKIITVRFHNCYARIYDRVRLFKTGDLSLVYKVNLRLFYLLEKEIFNDTNTYKIFISDEDRYYYVSNSGKAGDSEVWGFSPNNELILKNRFGISTMKRIVWFGGLDSHKIDSVKWFIHSVFPKLLELFPWLEFHLFGKDTEQFTNPTINILGHGFYKKSDMPYKSDAIYINPDLTGGGVKIKLLNYFESGVCFITTPYGYEGYSKDLIDGHYCAVVEPEKWFEFLKNVFEQNKCY